MRSLLVACFLASVYGSHDEKFDQGLAGPSCEAWKATQRSYISSPPPMTKFTKSTKALNFCRLIIGDQFRMRNPSNGKQLYFGCPHQPGGAPRLKVCVAQGDMHMCKVSIKYVHELLGKDGTLSHLLGKIKTLTQKFAVPLTELGAEFLGEQWKLSGSVKIDKSAVRLADGTVKLTLPDGSVETFVMMQNRSVAVVDADGEFDASAEDKCPQVNSAWKQHPCAKELKSMVEDFCERMTVGNILTAPHTIRRGSPELSFTCVETGHWFSSVAEALFTSEGAGQMARRSPAALFRFVDLDTGKFNIQFARGTNQLVASSHSCVEVDVYGGMYSRGTATLDAEDLHGEQITYEYLPWHNPLATKVEEEVV